MSDLVLHLKGEYFDQILAKLKPEEYRLATPYWTKRLEGRTYESVILCRGYPSAKDTGKYIIRKWRGAYRKTITHPHFGPEPVEVFAIRLMDEKP